MIIVMYLTYISRGKITKLGIYSISELGRY
ncbi:Uncharacterized [Moorella glycerini]|uniref:Uncharacterized protein n=1 Tax=Neomoorella stamsii TaxID=1266720 RepID=A0A9X7P7L0_9FIRM|nr:hypothetical protein MOST_03150 [Moorella stamsii]CEP67237.1 Uncharacterized [Moorella glycerini]